MEGDRHSYGLEISVRRQRLQTLTNVTSVEDLVGQRLPYIPKYGTPVAQLAWTGQGVVGIKSRHGSSAMLQVFDTSKSF